MKKNTGKRTFQPCVRDCRVKPTAFRRGLATESLTVPQERPKEKESPEHSSGGHPSRHINYNTDSDHPCQSPFRPGKQGVNQSSLCFHCHKDRHTGQHTHHTYQSVLTVWPAWEKKKYFPEECFIRPSSERKRLTPVPHRHPIIAFSVLPIKRNGLSILAPMISLWQTHQAHALSIYCPTLCVVQIPRNPSALPDEQFDSTLSSVIDSTLGLRCRSLGYQYSEIIRSLMSIYFCGGSCIEDVTTHLMNHLSLHPTLHTCSSDTILRAIKELTQENISYTSDTGKNYDFNTADTLNTLLLNCMFASDQLKEGEKYDAKPTYKKFSGYRPGVAVIGDLIVGIENSDGNTKVPFHGTFSRHGRA